MKGLALTPLLPHRNSPGNHTHAMCVIGAVVSAHLPVPLSEKNLNCIEDACFASPVTAEFLPWREHPGRTSVLFMPFTAKFLEIRHGRVLLKPRTSLVERSMPIKHLNTHRILDLDT